MNMLEGEELSREELCDVLDSLDEGVIVLDLEERVVYANDIACRHFGLGRDNCVGKLVKELELELSTEAGDEFLYDSWPFKRILKTGKPVTDFELVLSTNGETRILLISIHPLREKRKITGVALTIRDITRMKIATWKRDQFIKIMGHELKHPLASIQAYAYRFRKMARQVNPEAESYVDKLENQVEMMTEMLNSLLDTSKLVSRTLDVDLELGDLSVILNSVVDDIQPRFRSHELVCEIEEKIQCRFDEIRIRQVITNLVANAVKYSPDAKHVVIRLYDDEMWAIFEVEDSGVGIEPSNLKRIFQPYFRTASVQKKGFKGLGIGLFVAAEIVKKHYGTISVDSKLGKGSVFRVKLPLAANR